nr:hypothetical protein JVH1_3661 [Rhodococcus sp. JVH1]
MQPNETALPCRLVEAGRHESADRHRLAACATRHGARDLATRHGLIEL